MRRDLEFIREFLLQCEEENDFQFVHTEIMFNDAKKIEVLPRGWDWKKQYHYELLKDAAFVVELNGEFPTPRRYEEDSVIAVRKFRISNAGHDYLDAIRSDGIWEKTKDVVAKEGGNATLELVKSLAMSFARKQIEDRTGLKL
ncbi:MAG: DUF2513 domain-containing protein [Albidovulum sp.]